MPTVAMTRKKVWGVLALTLAATLISLSALLGPSSYVRLPCFIKASGVAGGGSPTTTQCQGLTAQGMDPAQEEGGVNDSLVPHPKGTRRRLPGAIIIGVRKGGTRALLAMLNFHPKVAAATEEIHFFDRDENYERGLDWYRRQMPYSYPDQVTIEKSPAYFITEETPRRIRRMDRNVKLLLVLRDPTRRVVSDYTQVHEHKLERHKDHEIFEDIAIVDGQVNTRYRAIKTSTYVRFMRVWLQHFPREQIHLVDGDRLVQDPLPELSKVETFLGIQHKLSSDNFYFNQTRGFYCMRSPLKQKCLSESKGRTHPYIQPAVLQTLQDYFRPYNQQLFQLVGQKFNWP